MGTVENICFYDSDDFANCNGKTINKNTEIKRPNLDQVTEQNNVKSQANILEYTVRHFNTN